jgi:hypothetical protein
MGNARAQVTGRVDGIPRRAAQREADAPDQETDDQSAKRTQADGAGGCM